MRWYDCVLYILKSIFVAAVLFAGPSNSNASDCHVISVGIYKEKLLLLKSEYEEKYLRIGADNIKGNELLVGMEIDSILQDVDTVMSIGEILSLFCDSGAKSRRSDIWKEVVDGVNGSLPTFHKNIQQSNELLAKSLISLNRFEGIAMRLRELVSGMKRSVPRNI